MKAVQWAAWTDKMMAVLKAEQKDVVMAVSTAVLKAEQKVVVMAVSTADLLDIYSAVHLAP